MEFFHTECATWTTGDYRQQCEARPQTSYTKMDTSPIDYAEVDSATAVRRPDEGELRATFHTSSPARTTGEYRQQCDARPQEAAVELHENAYFAERLRGGGFTLETFAHRQFCKLTHGRSKSAT